MKIYAMKVLFYLYFLMEVESFSQQNQDTDENDHHLLNILKDHEIISDIIDDASHADILEVRIFSGINERSLNLF